MFMIAVCDDEKIFRKSIGKYIEQYLLKRSVSFSIDMFSSGEEFLALGVEMMRYSIIFLDINMGKMDGIVTAQKIREHSLDMYIVFVTAYVDYSLEGYKVDAVRYLLKNNINLEASINECLETIFSKINYVIPKKNFKFNEGEKDILLERILYIESHLHKLEFHIMEDEIKIYTLYCTLNEMEKMMQGFNFVRIHQSFLVNLKHIKSVMGYRVTLSNGQELVVPKTRYKEVKNIFVAYRGEL